MPVTCFRSLVPWFQRTFMEFSLETDAEPDKVVELAVLGNVNRVMWGDNTYSDIPVKTDSDGTLTFTHRYATKGPRRNIRVHGDGITRMRARSTDLGSLRVRLLEDTAHVPVRASSDAAGYDLFAAFETVIPPRGREVVQTGLSIAVPKGTYGRVAPRSGLAIRDGIDVGGGVIDPDYRGEVAVVLFNHSDRPFVVESGDRIAQLVLEHVETPTVVVTDSLDETERGENGFGSTGKKDV